MNLWTRLIGWLSFGLLIIASFVSVLRYVEKAPFFYLGLETFLVLLFISYKSKKHNFIKVFAFNLAILALCFGAAEAYFAWVSDSMVKQEKVRSKDGLKKDADGYQVLDEIRGYAAAKGVKKRSKKMQGEKLIYDVLYTINDQGLRIAPHDLRLSKENGNSDYKNVVFFGDSFTFGEGVNDNETLPCIFEQISKGKYITYNFGFHGYGPHQMLRILETNYMDKIITDHKPMIAIYQALPYHIERASGNYPYILWDVNGPKYKLSPDGRVEFAGRFIDNQFHRDKRIIVRSLNKSYILVRTGVVNRLFGGERNQDDIELFIKIIIESNNLLKEKYNAKFYVVFWPLGEKDSDYVINKLKENGINVIIVDHIFMKYKDAREKYTIPGDAHPTKLAYERIAKYLLENLN